ncbi:MAG: NAD(P)/FAD-dependent oxidoreductase [Candidatus Scalindua sp.]|nr:NAD(P)/FAD-dependent oxidoreductase [Candidatus Scalindua sp.]
MQHFQVVIIGAGAAGLMCALSAGQRDRQVMLLDQAEKVGEKILISGGGHCNFTNMMVRSEHYLSNNPHFCKSALNRFTQHDFISLVKKHGVAYQEKALGQLFCQGAASEIVNVLLKECQDGGVRVLNKCAVMNIKKEKDFSVSTSKGIFETESLVIATGGLSLYRKGAAGFGYEIAKQYGLNVFNCEPGLVPLTLSSCFMKDIEDLSGISVDALVSCNGKSFREAVLFTHRGLSGPAILQISNYWRPGDEIIINLLPGINIVDMIEQWKKERPKADLKNLIGEFLPKRLAQRLLKLYLKNKPVNQYNKREINTISEIFHGWCICPSGTEGYRKAEVTKGGVDTDELSSKTFETKKVKGLYFIGEVVDVTGWLGGYNFQWAWSSGYCAGQHV